MVKVQFFTHTKQERTMKFYWLPALLVLLAAGCTPPSEGGREPAGNTSSSDLSLSSPGGGAEAAGNTTLVSLNIPGMT